MNFTVSEPQLIHSGADEAIMWVDEKAVAHLVKAVSGQLLYAYRPIDNGDFSNLSFTSFTMASADRFSHGLDVVHMPNRKAWFTWIDQLGAVKEAVHVDEPYTNESKSPYKLYYAVDTEKLYMNIDDNWEFIGSPNAENLYNFQGGGGTHPNPGTCDCAEAISELEARIQALEVLIANGGIPEPEP